MSERTPVYPSQQPAPIDDALLDVMAALRAEGWPEVEVYAKRGRSRTLRIGCQREAMQLDDELGWALRAGDDRRSVALAVSGTPRADLSWPEADYLVAETGVFHLVTGINHLKLVLHGDGIAAKAYMGAFLLPR